jgi:hypothetical protein
MSFKNFSFSSISIFPLFSQGSRLSLFPHNRYRKPADCRREPWLSKQRAAHKPSASPLTQVFFTWVNFLVCVRSSWRRSRRKQPPPSCVRSTSPAACVPPAAATHQILNNFFCFFRFIRFHSFRSQYCTFVLLRLERHFPLTPEIWDPFSVTLLFSYGGMTND